MISFQRRFKSRLAVIAAWLAVTVALLPLVHMFWIVLSRGIAAFSLTLFTQTTQGRSGGLLNAISGTILLVGLAMIIAVPLGLLSGIVSAERPTRWARTVRLMSNMLAGVPSIVVGYFGYVVFVGYFGWGFALLAGSISLAIIMLPFIFRATDLAIAQVPPELRTASLALGASQTTAVRTVVLRAALPGIVTGILLAVGTAVGETAPLIYTAGWSNYLPALRLTHAPVGYLTYVIWAFINEPFASANALAYAAALVLLALVVMLNMAARWALARKS